MVAGVISYSAAIADDIIPCQCSCPLGRSLPSLLPIQLLSELHGYKLRVCQYCGSSFPKKHWYASTFVYIHLHRGSGEPCCDS